MAGVIGCVVPPESWPLPSGLGGVMGDLVLKLPSLALGGYPTGLAALVIGAVLLAPALYLFAFACGLVGRRIARPDTAVAGKQADQDDFLYAGGR